MLGSHAMAQLIQNLSKAFDLVIIDSAPLLPVNDTKILSRMADAVLFVIRWEKTPREAAGLLRLFDVVLQHHEFVAAKAGERIGFAQAGA